jgi:hypothetical protein
MFEDHWIPKCLKMELVKILYLDHWIPTYLKLRLRWFLYKSNIKLHD